MKDKFNITKKGEIFILTYEIKILAIINFILNLIILGIILVKKI